MQYIFPRDSIATVPQRGRSKLFARDFLLLKKSM